MLQPDLNYHTSALLAAAVDNMTLPFRLDSNPTLVSHFTSSMVLHARKVRYFVQYYFASEGFYLVNIL